MFIKDLSTASERGLRDYNEDRFITHVDMEGTLVAVFDGHGGSDTANLVSKSVAEFFVDSMDVYGEGNNPKGALEETIARLAKIAGNNRSGSTASLVFIPSEGETAFTAVLGDSPILIGNATDLWVGPDHNVRTNEAEADAVIERGGTITNGYAMNGFSGDGLQMGRALGDRSLARILSTKPEINEVPITEGGFILVATDGVFDPGHREQAASVKLVTGLMRSNSHGLFSANDIVLNALDRKTGDNVTAVVVRL